MSSEKAGFPDTAEREFIERVSVTVASNIPDDDGVVYRSRIDGAYFTRVGHEDEGFNFLIAKGITEQLQNCKNISNHTVNIGFNTVEQKWYGWSHRALFGFGVGSETKKGDVGYKPTDKDDYLEDCIRFWDDKEHENTHGVFVEGGVQISWEYGESIENEKPRGGTSGVFCEFPEDYGAGEWVAETLDDAKQMAIDFAENVD